MFLRGTVCSICTQCVSRSDCTISVLLDGIMIINTRSPVPKRQILNSSKLKEVADDNFKFDENGRKFSKQVKKTVGKGEIARY